MSNGALINPTNTTPALKVQEFTFSYPGQNSFVLGPLSWQVEQGDFNLLIGGTGCGKTTLLQCCKPEIAPVGEVSGLIEVFGKNALRRVGASEARGADVGSTDLVGFVFQNPENQAVCSEVWHELAFGLENKGVPVGEMRRRVAEVAHFFGIESWLHKSTDSLSGGQKQILNVASVLALNPKILILDEPTAQLDPIAESNLLHALFRINRELGITVIASTHHVEAMAPYAKTISAFQGSQIVSRPVEETEYATANTYANSTNRGLIDALSVSQQESLSATGKYKFGEAFARNSGLPVIGKDMTVSYGRTETPVLRGCHIQIESGSIHALVGGNGCGKTTLLKTIAGTLKPFRGRMINVLSKHQIYVPQDPKVLFVCDSVWEELKEWQKGCGYSDQDIQQKLEEFGLAGCKNQHPYDLSGGQQQLLALCKVLLTKPQLMLIDEPTKGLDVAAKILVAETLQKQAKQGVTIVLSSHDLSFVCKVANKVSMLFDGEVTCTEPASEFFQNNFFYRPIYDGFAKAYEVPAPAEVIAPNTAKASASGSN